MKLRIKGNSIRVRVTRSELEALNTAGEIAETTVFSPARQLIWRVCSDARAEQLCADFDANVLTVRIPTRLVQHWNQADVISLQGTQTVSAKQGLSILLEKDFPCLTPRPGEDDSDAFSRPVDAGSACSK